MSKLKAILAGTLIGLAGCEKHPEYKFNGKIGDETVYFREDTLGCVSMLSIIRGNKRITYIDNERDGELDSISVMENGDHTSYRNDKAGKEIIEIGQKQFDEYLAKILETKKAKGLEQISK